MRSNQLPTVTFMSLALLTKSSIIFKNNEVCATTLCSVHYCKILTRNKLLQPRRKPIKPLSLLFILFCLKFMKRNFEIKTKCWTQPFPSFSINITITHKWGVWHTVSTIHGINALFLKKKYNELRNGIVFHYIISRGEDKKLGTRKQGR